VEGERVTVGTATTSIISCYSLTFRYRLTQVAPKTGHKTSVIQTSLGSPGKWPENQCECSAYVCGMAVILSSSNTALQVLGAKISNVKN